MRKIVITGTSLDGDIADQDGGLGFLQSVPHPDNDELGYPEFMSGIGGLLIGRRTYETVLGYYYKLMR